MKLTMFRLAAAMSCAAALATLATIAIRAARRRAGPTPETWGAEPYVPRVVTFRQHDSFGPAALHDSILAGRTLNARPDHISSRCHTPTDGATHMADPPPVAAVAPDFFAASPGYRPSDAVRLGYASRAAQAEVDAAGQHREVALVAHFSGSDRHVDVETGGAWAADKLADLHRTTHRDPDPC